MKKIIILGILMCNPVAGEGLTDLFIKFSNFSVEEAIQEINSPPTIFEGYCEVIAEVNELENESNELESEIEQDEPPMSESECEQHILNNKKKCTAQLSSKKILSSFKEIEELSEAYVECVMDL